MNENQITENDNSYQLTERQITILRRKGLPINFDELTQRQKKSIEDIEVMLQYVESKYGIDFIYVDYTAEKELESGILTAYPASGEKNRDIFSICRVSKTNFQDTYNLIIVRDGYEKILNEHLKNIIDEDYKSFSQISETSLNASPTNIAECSGLVSAKSWIFIKNKSTAKWDEITEAVISWMQANHIEGSVYVVSVSDNIINEINDHNYTDYLTGKFVNGHRFANAN